MKDPEDFIDPDENEDVIEDPPEDDLEPEPEPKAEPVPDDDKDDKPVTGKELRQIRQELKEARQARAEADENARYWHGQAKAAPAPVVPQREEEPAFDGDMVETISANDPQKFAAMLDRLGFVRKDEVNRTVTVAQRQILDHNKLLTDFPGMADEKSEFFQAAARHFQEAVNEDPAAKTQPQTLRNAAKMARLELAGKETPADRARRVSGQGGEHGTPRRSAGTELGDMSAAQKRIVQQLAAAGHKITDDDYRKQAKLGVQMSGRPRGRSSDRRAA